MTLKLLNCLLIFIIFSAGLVVTGHTIIDIKVSYMIMILSFFPLVHLSKGLKYHRKSLNILLIVSILSIASIYMGNNSFFLLMKAWIGIAFSSLVFYLLFKANKFDLRKLFQLYLNLAFLVGLIGLFQEIFYLVDFKWGYDFSTFLPSWKVCLSQSGLLKVNSILPEPASFCYSMMPAFFVAFNTVLRGSCKLLTNPKSLVIIISVFLSMSLVGYVGIVFCILTTFLNYQRKRYLVFCLILIGALFVGSYMGIDDIRLRVDDTIGVLTRTTSSNEANLSTFTYFTNLAISYYGFIDNPLFGTGLGSRELTYYSYIDKVSENTNHSLLNIKDANSLFLRITTELGLLGLILVAIFICKFYVGKKLDRSCYLWLISNSILAFFMIKLLRSGHYFNNGMFFFVWLYYFAGKKSLDEKKSLKIA